MVEVLMWDYGWRPEGEVRDAYLGAVDMLCGSGFPVPTFYI